MAKCHISMHARTRAHLKPIFAGINQNLYSLPAQRGLKCVCLKFDTYLYAGSEKSWWCWIIFCFQIIMVRLQRVTFMALHNYLGLSYELLNPVSACDTLTRIRVTHWKPCRKMYGLLNTSQDGWILNCVAPWLSCWASCLGPVSWEIVSLLVILIKRGKDNGCQGDFELMFVSRLSRNWTLVYKGWLWSKWSYFRGGL